MAKLYSKRGGYLTLGSYDLDHIFGGITHNYSKEKVQSIFLFEIMELSNVPKEFSKKKVLNLPIRIPKHSKYLRFNIYFDNFDELYEYMYNNRNDNLIIPFYGEDI
jgi:hypothetical protein